MIGITSVVFNLAVGFTGVWWTCERVANGLRGSNPAGGETPPAAPFLLPREHVSLDAFLTESARRLPGFRLTNLSLPDRGEGEVTLTGSVPSWNPLRSPYGSQAIFVVPGGTVKEVRDIRQAGWGAQLYDVFIPVHYGTFGALPIKILWALGGLAPGLLTVSGFLIWRVRRQPRKKAAPAVLPPAGVLHGKQPI